ncbi:MAG: hypothetical protein WA820_19445 [Bradyrhizobium sp.]
MLSATASMVLSPLKKRRSVMRALKMLRTKLIATMALTLLSGGTPAIAQNQGAGSSGAASSTIPEAPIGHRQPRADQVPPENNLINPNDLLAKENAILDRKMKSICRGC